MSSPDDFWCHLATQHTRPIPGHIVNQSISAALIMAGNETPEGAARLAALHYYGWGAGQPDYPRALFNARAAAAEDHPWGHFFAGLCLHHGRGTAADPATADEHLLAAAAGGVPVADLADHLASA